METKEIIKKVKKLEITTRHLVEGLITGNYHSVFKGQGIEFSDIREYRPGDDVRAIDWKVTARFNHPYIKEFIEERDLRVYFAFDISASSSFGSEITKKTKAMEVIAGLMFAAMHNNDNVGLFMFTDSMEHYIPARKGKKHILKMLSRLISYQPVSSKTDLESALIHVSKVVKKRSIIFIISDFYDKDFSKPLKILRNKHDIIALRIIDPRELEIPDVGLIELEDEETGEQILLDTSDPEFRSNYQKIISEKENELRTSLNRAKIDLVNIMTDQAYEVPLKKFFNKRITRLVR
ncbi:MAG: DUF58 domain-containing protein [Vulcanimicrobiota bacterium]